MWAIPPSGSHQVDLAWANDLLTSEAVAVEYFALDHPSEGLQAGVRVGADTNALAFVKRDGANMIQKTPRTNHASLASGQGSVDDQAFDQLRSACRNAFNRQVCGIDFGHRMPFSESSSIGLRQGKPCCHQTLLLLCLL